MQIQDRRKADLYVEGRDERRVLKSRRRDVRYIVDFPVKMMSKPTPQHA